MYNSDVESYFSGPFFTMENLGCFLFSGSKRVPSNSTLRDAQGLGGRLLDAKPVPAVGGAKQLVLPAFFRPSSVLAMLAFMAIIPAP